MPMTVDGLWLQRLPLELINCIAGGCRIEVRMWRGMAVMHALNSAL